MIAFNIPHLRLPATLMFLVISCTQVLADVALPGGDKDKKKKKKDEVERQFLPEAKPIIARYISGMTVDVELDAATASVVPVRFIIREMPQHGTLSPIRPHPKDLHKAIVTYTHTGGAAQLVDRFTYACQVGGGSWSAPGVVSLIGKRADPKVELIVHPKFPKVLPGYESTARIRLKNSGIAPFSADMQWQPPWTGPARIDLAIGEEKEFNLSVKPTAPGTLIWETEIQPGFADSKVRLWVECAQIFTVSPGLVKMIFDPARGARYAKINVVNSTNKAMKVGIEPPPRTTVAKEIEIPAKLSTEVEIALAADDVEAFQGDLWVVHEPYRERVRVTAAPEPAQLRLLQPQTIDFGNMVKGKAAQAKITVQNIGGEAAVVAAQSAAPFRVSEADGALSLAPGEARDLTIEATADAAGKFSSNVVFSGTGGQISLPVKALITDPNTPQPIKPVTIENPRSMRKSVASKNDDGVNAQLTSTGGATPSPLSASGANLASASQAALLSAAAEVPTSGGTGERKFGFEGLDNTQAAIFSYLATFGMPIPKELRSATMPKIEGIELVKRATDHLVLAWSELKENPREYVLELGYRVRNQETGLWLKAWQSPKNVEKISGEAGKRTVRLTDLVPNARYEVRVLAMDEDGKVSEPSDIHIFSTAAPWRMPSWTWNVLALIALGILGFVFHRLKSGAWKV
jgi:hypothetical protein